ncbi:hypothetical protein B5723_14960 [Mammaliicoccus sciuri]|nr:hypothetical protein B5723_14960 [Mammaliicoccus sciuri]
MRNNDSLVSIFTLFSDFVLFIIFSTIAWKYKSNIIDFSSTLTSNKIVELILPLIIISAIAIIFLLIRSATNILIIRIFD